MLAIQSAHVQPMLAEYCLTRDVSLRNALVEHYLYMAEAVARRFYGRGVEYDDLFQVASMALLQALERFDMDKGLQFVTFAAPTLVGVVRNYIRDKGRLIRMPRRGVELYAKASAARDALAKELGREPAIEEIAAQIRVREDDLMHAMEMHYASQALSLDAPTQVEDEALPLDAQVGEVDSAFERMENRDMLLRTLELLEPMERDVVIRRFVDRKSQRETARALGVSQMQVSRLERKVYAKLRGHLTER